MHDKVIIADGRNIEVGSFNYTRSADRVNSENVLVVGCSSRCSTLSAALVDPLVAGNGLETGLLTHLSHKTSINTVHLRPC